MFANAAQSWFMIVTAQISRETIYGDVQKLLMKEMSSILHDDILIGQQRVPLFKIRVLDGFQDKVVQLERKDNKSRRCWSMLWVWPTDESADRRKEWGKKRIEMLRI